MDVKLQGMPGASPFPPSDFAPSQTAQPTLLELLKEAETKAARAENTVVGIRYRLTGVSVPPQEAAVAQETRQPSAMEMTYQLISRLNDILETLSDIDNTL